MKLLFVRASLLPLITVSPRYAGLFLGGHGFADYFKNLWPCSTTRPSQRMAETALSTLVEGKWR